MTLRGLLATLALALPALAAPPPATIPLDPKTLSFRHPGTGEVFTLHLGEEMNNETGGITAVPRGIRGIRNATSSYWEPKDSSGCGYHCAESSLTRDSTWWLRHLEIQVAPDSGNVLITEDLSDASPCVRHILFTKCSPCGYSVSYLAPDPVVIPRNQPAEFHELPSRIRLLPGNRAEINGRVRRLSRIRQSPHPFCLGG